MVQKGAGEELQGQIEVIEETEELTAVAASNKDGKFDVGEAIVSRANRRSTVEYNVRALLVTNDLMFRQKLF